MLNATTAAAVVLCGLVGTHALAQSTAPNPAQRRPSAEQRDGQPVFRVTVVGRTTPAINYRHRSGATTIDLEGTPLLPDARGEAKVESKRGYIEIEVEFDDMRPATRFGPEYLTYVMWAITPEGRASNLGEVLLDEDETEGKLNVTTELQAFGLVVTAEPYFAVSQPSDVVVLENEVRPETEGAVEAINVRYDLLQRGAYLLQTDPDDLPSRELEDDVPLELYEARNALHFARVAGADEYAVETFQRARNLLDRAEDMHEDDRSEKEMIAVARQAAQTAEDARLIAHQRRAEEAAARERERLEARESAARDAELEARRRAEREQEERARADAERREAELAARQAARERQQADAQRSAAERRLQDAERERLALEEERREAERRRAEAEAAQAAADRARLAAEDASARLADERRAAEERARRLDAERASAEARAQAAADAAAEAERERAELRRRLQQQLDAILETRESARGLIVNMSDVLFDYDSAALKPGAREKLARVAGVLLAYPELEISVEGHTDSMGTDEYNQQLSERRAASVRAYLVSQGIPPRTIEAMGFGESRPVVANTTAAGRQQNRRVELVIAGESIAAATER